MSQIKSYAVGNGDMYWIRHGSDNFSIIDCSMPSERRGSMLAELSVEQSQKGITRFISTHPDQDHISGLVDLDDTLGLVNFYCVANEAAKSAPTADFLRYCALRDSSKAFYLHRGCSRRWMNSSDETRGSAGLNVVWPIPNNEHHLSALDDAAHGMKPNNISCILKYSLKDGPTVLWMGDLETDFMEKLESVIDMPSVDILFAPHHGRTSGKVPPGWLEQLAPALIVVGQAPSEYLDYYSGYDTITQNSTGDLLFDCQTGVAHIYAESATYTANCLADYGLDTAEGLYYVGSVETASS